jgi:hypothetical protein
MGDGGIGADRTIAADTYLRPDHRAGRDHSPALISARAPMTTPGSAAPRLHARGRARTCRERGHWPEQGEWRSASGNSLHATSTKAR